LSSFGFSPEEDSPCDPIGIHISSESPTQFHYDLTVNVTKSVRLSLVAIVESEPQDTTEAQLVWRDVAHALGELQMWLLGPATQTASRSTRS
jgi:hypothetical protein